MRRTAHTLRKRIRISVTSIREGCLKLVRTVRVAPEPGYLAWAYQETDTMQPADAELQHAKAAGICVVCRKVTLNPVKPKPRRHSDYVCRTCACLCSYHDPQNGPYYKQMQANKLPTYCYEKAADLKAGTMKDVPLVSQEVNCPPFEGGVTDDPEGSVPVITCTRCSQLYKNPPLNSHANCAAAMLPLIAQRFQLPCHHHERQLHATGASTCTIFKPTTDGFLSYAQTPGLLKVLLETHPFVCLAASRGHLNGPTVSFQAWREYLAVLEAAEVDLSRVFFASAFFLVAPDEGGHPRSLPDFCLFSLEEWRVFLNTEPLHLPQPQAPGGGVLPGAINQLNELQRMALYCQLEAHYGHVDDGWRNLLL